MEEVDGYDGWVSMRELMASQRSMYVESPRRGQRSKAGQGAEGDDGCRDEGLVCMHSTQLVASVGGVHWLKLDFSCCWL